MSRLTSSLIAKRGLTAWLAFGATGLATGAVWASGFATSTAATTAPAAPLNRPALAKTAPAVNTSALNGKATAVDPARVRLGRPLGLDRRQHRDVQGQPERRLVRRQDLQHRHAAGQHVRPHRLGLAAAQARAGPGRRRRHVRPGRLHRLRERQDPQRRRPGRRRLLERPGGRQGVLPRHLRWPTATTPRAPSCAPPRTHRRPTSRRSSRRSTAPPKHRTARATPCRPPVCSPTPRFASRGCARPPSTASRRAGPRPSARAGCSSRRC